MRIFLFLVLFSPLSLHASDCVVLYSLGGEREALQSLRKGLQVDGIEVRVVQAQRDIGLHLKQAESINEEGCLLFIAFYAEKGVRDSIFVGIPKAVGVSRGMLLAPDDMPYLYLKESERIALSIPSAHVRRIPLFPLLGIKAPGVFLYVRYRSTEVLESVAASLCSALRKGGGR